MMLFIMTALLACGDSKKEMTKTTTTEETKTTESSSSSNISVTPTTSSTKLDSQTPMVKEFVKKSVGTSGTLETPDANTDTTNTTESKE